MSRELACPLVDVDGRGPRKLPVVALDECHEGATLPAALEWVRNVHRKRQEERAATVIALGAKDAGVDPTELVARLDASPEKQELFVRTLRVAQDAAVDEKLIALGKAIASGLLAYRSVDVQWETAFVGTLSELDRPHLRVLDQVRRLAFDSSATPQQTFPEPASVTEESLHQSIPELRDIIDTVVATLQSHGLLAAVQGQMATIGPTSRRLKWKVTNFGLQFLERMRLVGDTLAQQEGG